jgi:hypothetical protein
LNVIAAASTQTFGNSSLKGEAMQFSGWRNRILRVVICLASICLAITIHAAPVEKPRTFELRVQFGVPWKRTAQIKTNINPNVPFSGQVTDNDGHRYKIGGMLLPHTKGKYRVVITALRWDELSGETFETLVLDLELNKTVTVCSSDGVVHECVATTLTKRD